MATEKVQVLLRMEPELKAALKVRADKEDRSLSNLIVHASQTYLETAKTLALKKARGRGAP